MSQCETNAIPTSTQQQLSTTCITSDGAHVTVENALLVQCRLFRDILNFVQSNNEPMPIEVNKEMFTLAIDWMEMHRSATDDGSTGPSLDWCSRTEESRMLHMTPAQEIFFKKLDLKKLLELMMAADFLNLSRLYLLGCQRLCMHLRYGSADLAISLFGFDDNKEEVTEVESSWNYEAIPIMNQQQSREAAERPLRIRRESM